MKSYKKSATVIGILFLIALIFNIIASTLFEPILNDEDYLSKAYPQRHLVVAGNLLNIICAIAMIFIPIVLFSVTKQANENLAICYIIFRGLEGILFIFISIKTLSFIGISKDFIDSAATTSSIDMSIGNTIDAEIHWAAIIYLITFCSGAFLFYFLLFQSQLVPKWLSIWGLVGTVFLITGTVMGIFEVWIFKIAPLMKGMIYFAPPIALNEFVLSLWLIIKGFSPSARFGSVRYLHSV